MGVPFTLDLVQPVSDQSVVLVYIPVYFLLFFPRLVLCFLLMLLQQRFPNQMTSQSHQKLAASPKLQFVNFMFPCRGHTHKAGKVSTQPCSADWSGKWFFDSKYNTFEAMYAWSLSTFFKLLVVEKSSHVCLNGFQSPELLLGAFRTQKKLEHTILQIETFITRLETIIFRNG